MYGPRANVWYEPGDPSPLRLEWEKTRRLFNKLRGGYHPLRAAQLPTVTLLVRRNGEYRAMRYNGQHRLAALSHLGRKRLTVLVPSARALNAELASWPSRSSLPKRRRNCREGDRSKRLALREARTLRTRAGVGDFSRILRLERT